MNKTQASRLLTLAWFIRGLPREKLRMTVYSGDSRRNHDQRPVDLHACGSGGCAIGWSSVVFPHRFTMPFYNEVELDGRKAYCYTSNVANFFGLTLGECEEVFGPFRRTPDVEAGILERHALKHGWMYA